MRNSISTLPTVASDQEGEYRVLLKAMGNLEPVFISIATTQLWLSTTLGAMTILLISPNMCNKTRKQAICFILSQVFSCYPFFNTRTSSSVK